MEPLEYITLRKYLPQLQAAVKADLTTITAKLRAKGVLSDKGVARLKDKSKSVDERSANLVVMVMNMVKLNPEHYNVFVDILQQSGIGVIQPMKTWKQTLTRSATVSTVSGREERVLIEGNLQKLGRRFKGWHQRYFRIKGSHMYYYKKADGRCLGEINLVNCHYCEPSSFATFGAAFEILTTMRSHILAAPNKEEMHRWIRAIKQNIKLSESAYARLREQATMRRQMVRKQSVPKRPAPIDPKAHKLSRHMSFSDSDDNEEDDEINVDSHRQHVQAVYDLEASQSLRTSPAAHVQHPPIHTSMSADALTQLVAIEEKHQTKSSKKPATTKPQGVTKASTTKGETMTMDRRSYSRKVSVPSVTVTNTDAKNTADDRYSNKSATLPGRGRKTGATTGSGETMYVPKFLLNRFNWDKIRRILDVSSESMDKPLHDTLPPQDTPWMRETSAVEQLRVFLETQP